MDLFDECMEGGVRLERMKIVFIRMEGDEDEGEGGDEEREGGGDEGDVEKVSAMGGNSFFFCRYSPYSVVFFFF